MDQDDKLILKILYYVRDNADGSKPLCIPNCNDYAPNVIRFHVELCEERGYIVLSKGKMMSGAVGILRLTAFGIDYIRDNQNFV